MVNKRIRISYPCLLCDKHAIYDGKTLTAFCKYHKKYNIVKILQKKCPKCGRMAMYNTIGLCPVYCIYHRYSNMVNIYDEYTELNNEFFENTLVQYDKYVSSLL